MRDQLSIAVAVAAQRTLSAAEDGIGFNLSAPDDEACRNGPV